MINYLKYKKSVKFLQEKLDGLSANIIIINENKIWGA